MSTSGRRFTLVTDHCPLKSLKTLKDPTGRIGRWLLLLEEYPYDIVYRAGTRHGNADGLSRMPMGGQPQVEPVDDGSDRMDEILEPVEPVGDEKLKGEEKGIKRGLSVGKVEQREPTKSHREKSTYKTGNETEITAVGKREMEREEKNERQAEEKADTGSDGKQKKDGMNAVGVLPKWTRNYLSRIQKDDEILGRVRQVLPGPRPAASGEWATNPQLAQCRLAWESFLMKEDVLYRRLNARQGARTEEREVVVVPKALVPEVLKQSHENGGHMGITRTKELIKERFWWPGVSLDVAEWIESCGPCEQKKKPVGNPRALMKSVPVGEPMRMWAMDFVGPLAETEDGNKYLLVVSDYFTKWVEAFPLKDQTAAATARALNELFARHGVPAVLHSDQGRNFESKLIKELCKEAGVAKTRTTPYHPQCDGLVERSNQTIITMLSKVIDENQRNWDKKLPPVLMAYRTSRHESTGKTPFELVYGRKAKLPVSWRIDLGEDRATTTTDYAGDVTKQLAAMEDEAALRMERAQTRQRQGYDVRTTEVPEYTEGDVVWLHTPAVKRGESRKLARPYKGPYVIVHRLNDVNVTIRRIQGGRTKRVHCNRLKPCHYRLEPENVVSSEDDRAEAEAGRDRKRRNRRLLEKVLPAYRDYVPNFEEDVEQFEIRDGLGAVEGRQPRRAQLPARFQDYQMEVESSTEESEDAEEGDGDDDYGE